MDILRAPLSDQAPDGPAATVGALTIEELRQQLPWAIANVLRAADIEPPDDYVVDES